MKKILTKVFFVIVIAMMTSLLHAAEFGPNSANINNPYLPAKVGIAQVEAGYGTKTGLFGYIDMVGTNIVDGVNCVRLNVVDTFTPWFIALWFAQDISGNVYVLKYYETDDLTPVVLGKDNALLMMSTNPQVGHKIWADEQTVVEIGFTVPQLSTGLGPFTNCIKTIDEDGDILYYAPNIGRVKQEYSGGSGWELKEIFNTKSGVAVIPLFD